MTMQVDKARLDEMPEGLLPRSALTDGSKWYLLWHKRSDDGWLSFEGRYENGVLHYRNGQTSLHNVWSHFSEIQPLRSTEGKEGEDIDPILIEQLKRERDEALDQRNMTLIEMGKEMSRAEAAEAHVAKLREALEPFAKAAEFYEPEEEDDQSSAWASVFDIGDLRRARAALTRSPE